MIIKEKEIKAALIDWLEAKGMVQDAVIINEMVVANWTRRADIAIANGRLYGFEIKSEADSLKRLPGQIESFSNHFDKVTIVAASKFINQVKEEYPSEIGILEAYRIQGTVKIKQVRAGKLIEIKDHASLGNLITKLELSRILKSYSTPHTVTDAKNILIEKTKTMPTKVFKQYVLSCIKARHINTHCAFYEARKKRGSLLSLGLLSKQENMRRVAEKKEQQLKKTFSTKNSFYERQLDINLLERECGALPDFMPRTIKIKRKLK
ncbi:MULTISPECIES: sce7726 family protein [unclassified Pseudomonas]|uniref:sce7726 family protein n=1 Tax=unclassified Pseudomonas TaxID=196821 RepID=UPI000A1DD62F|nr:MULTISPECIES: sce7726 family protein [unclassified Pseudomonas]